MLCAVANLLEVFEGESFRCRIGVFFYVGMLIMFDSAPESFRKSFSRSGDWKFLFFRLSKRLVLSELFVGGDNVFYCLWYILFILDLISITCGV